MGYFAVLVQNDASAYAKFIKIKRLHINIWSLRGLWPGRRLFYFDVGLELHLKKSKRNPLSYVDGVEILLPFIAEEGKWPNGAPIVQDLYEMVIDDHSCPLIFGMPVKAIKSINGRANIEFSKDRLVAGRIREGCAKLVENEFVAGDSSSYLVSFQRPVEQGESVYFRMRWRVFGAAPLWKWVRAEAGARVDFRVCDTRQMAAWQREPGTISRILPVMAANIFITAPASFIPMNVSPFPKHVRMLESDAWIDYLRGAARWKWMVKDLLVYGWSRGGEADRHITGDNPLRIFAALNRPASKPKWLIFMHILTGVIAVWMLLNGRKWVSDALNIPLDMTPIAGFIGISSVAGLWAILQRVKPFFEGSFRRPRQFFRRIERFFLVG